MADFIQLVIAGSRDRRDLCARRDRLHAALADLADDQFRPRRVRHGAGVLRARGHDGARLAVLAGGAVRDHLLARGARLRLQVSDRRSADRPEGHAAAGHLDDRGGAAAEGRRQGILQRRRAALPDHPARYADRRPRRARSRWRRSACSSSPSSSIALLQWFLGGTRTGRQMQATRAEPDRRAHPRHPRRAHDPLRIPDQCRRSRPSPRC